MAKPDEPQYEARFLLEGFGQKIRRDLSTNAGYISDLPAIATTCQVFLGF
jgi:hypothetical protein